MYDWCRLQWHVYVCLSFCHWIWLVPCLGVTCLVSQITLVVSMLYLARYQRRNGKKAGLFHLWTSWILLLRFGTLALRCHWNPIAVMCRIILRYHPSARLKYNVCISCLRLVFAVFLCYAFTSRVAHLSLVHIFIFRSHFIKIKFHLAQVCPVLSNHELHTERQLKNAV